MDKKDIYEHLAKIYLDASQKKKKRTKKHLGRRGIFFGLSILILGSAFVLASGAFKKKASSLQYALLLQQNVAKINFNFDPACKETYSIDLKKMDISRFKVLGFSIKKRNYEDTISLRVEFTNTFNEKSEIYLKNIGYRWHDYKIPVSFFKNIHDWTEMSQLAFVVEQWNAKNKDGVVYIDNVELLH